MKRIISLTLVLCMLFCMLPVFSMATAAAEGEVASGLNATLYQLVCAQDKYNERWGDYEAIIQGKNGRGADCSYNDSKHFDASIDTMLKISKEWPEFSGQTSSTMDLLDKNGYILKWDGTVTATESGTYYLVGRKIDNGFVAFVDQNDDGVFSADEKFYEYWAENHWFDGGEDRLLTDLGGFTLEAGVETKIQLWYLEIEGGDVCQINVSKNADGADDKSFADQGLTLALTRTCYVSNIVSNHDRVNAVVPQGVGGGACTRDDHNKDNHDGNCSSCTDAANQTYDASIAGLKAEMFELAKITLPSFEKDAFQGLSKYGFLYEDSLIEYTGYMTTSDGGEYQFGTASVDNCLMIEIEINGTWTRVYEFWASKVWNDVSTTWSETKVNLEANTSYPIRVSYLEIDGGEGLTTKVKINGEEFGILEKVAFTTAKPTAPVKPTQINLFDGTQEWYYKTSGAGNEFQIRDNAWMTDPAVYGTWDKAANPGSHWGTAEDPANNQSLWAVTTFEIASLAEVEGYELMMRIAYDDNIRMYVNGKLVNIELGWSNGTATWSLGEEASEILKEGTNTIAMKLVQGWGGSSVNVESVYLTLEDNGNNPYEYKYFDAQGNKVSGIITTADEWLAYAAIVNEKGGDGTRNDRILIAADLDFAGKEWIPMNVYIGRIFGDYHTFKNITYTATVDATGKGEGANVGLLTNSLANNNANGHVENLTFENCKLTVNATNGAGNEFAIAGIVAGMVDRGRIENVTVKGSTIDGNAAAAGAVAGVACWNFDDNGVHVENCAVIDTTVTATKVAGGAVAYARGGDTVRIGNVYAENVTLNAPNSGIAYGALWGWGENVKLYSTTLAGENRIGQTLASSPDADYTFYYQMRENGDGTYDYRIICVANKAWATAKESIEVNISFFAGAAEKSTTQVADTVYEKVTATADGLTEVYSADAESVIFGWIIENVPADYVEEAPVAEINN
ncbi:MAG: hypothetical protein IKC63_07390 [Clostridia bacterium]|nr:hypothetical protein [Clostridia bacterium]